MEESQIAALSHTIQLAVAPVFLLTGIGSILAVMTNRLARVVDRARAIEGPALEPSSDASLREELSILARRARLIGTAITLFTTTALLVGAVIAVMFVSAFFAWNWSAVVVAAVFVCAMVTFCGGLVMFLREILLATSTLRFGSRATTPSHPA
jgi:MFS family permease